MLVADDFGLSPSINQAVDQLARSGRLQGASCMVLPATIEPLRQTWLAGNSADFRLGLHFTLTNHRLFTETNVASFAQILRRSVLRTIDPARVRREFENQLSHFVKIFGRAPDYVDGHQFVQQLPVIRTAILASLRETRSGMRVRVFDQPGAFRWASAWRRPHAALVTESKILFGRALKEDCRRQGISCTRYLFSVEFGPGTNYQQNFEAILKHYDSNEDMVYFHPSASENDADLIPVERISSRSRDFRFLQALTP